MGGGGAAAAAADGTDADGGGRGELAEEEEAADDAAAAAVRLERKCTAAACRLCGGTWLKMLKEYRRANANPTYQY